MKRFRPILWILCLLWPAIPAGKAQMGSSTAETLFHYFSSFPAIDTHDHLPPFDRLPGFRKTPQGRGMNLAGLWLNSYFNWVFRLPGWDSDEGFQQWWKKAQPYFENGSATSVYRYQLPAFRDLYGVDFSSLNEQSAAALNRRVFDNYRTEAWLHKVITEKANIELMLNDPWWDYLGFSTYYPFEVLVFNVNPLLDGYHPDQFREQPSRVMSPYQFAREHGVPVTSLDDYLNLIDQLFQEASRKGAVSLKTTAANRRTLSFERVEKRRAERVFGRSAAELSETDVKAFQDFLIWHLAALSARYKMPFQIHTGLGKMEGSSPLHLLNLIEANPQTQFVLFHGGFPWTRESGAIAMSMLMKRHGNVWLDSVWLPILSYSMALRTFDEWLDMLPSDRILWGADCNHAEGIYGSTITTRRCLAETLARKVSRDELTLEQARRIGRQILRENALRLFPRLRDRLWK